MLKKLFDIWQREETRREVWTYNSHRIRLTIRVLDYSTSVVEVANWANGWREMFNYSFVDQAPEEVIAEALSRTITFINGS